MNKLTAADARARYDCYYTDGYGDDCAAKPRRDPDGDWLRADDALAHIRALEAENAALRKALDRIEDLAAHSAIKSFESEP